MKNMKKWLFVAIALPVLAPACASLPTAIDEPDEQDSLPLVAKAGCNAAARLPEALKGGITSAVGVQDLDGDGCKDVIYFSALEDPRTFLIRREVVIAWGSSATGKQAYSTVPTGLADLKGGIEMAWNRFWLRDQSVRLFVPAKGASGRGIVLSSLGRISSTSSRKLLLEPYSGGGVTELETLPPVLAFGPKSILRAAATGGFEQCDIATLRCTPWLNDTSTLRTPYREGIAVDLDGDGGLDIVGGRTDEGYQPGVGTILRSYAWFSRDRYAKPIALEGLESRQLQAADFNRDGVQDLVALQSEVISDFPSYATLAEGTRSGPPRIRRNYIVGFDNHSDSPAVLDADGDGHIDLLECGVDRGLGVLWGTKSGLPSVPAQANFTGFSTLGSIGIQAIDLNGDGKLELVVRHADPSAPGLSVLPLPKR